jgi:Flp pilus assembly protein TadD
MTEDRGGLDVRRLLQAAMACYAADRFDEAARMFGDVLPRITSPKLPEAWNCYGQALVHTGRLEEAVEALVEAVKLAPEDWRVWETLGGVYFALDRPERARDALLRATQLNRDDAELWSKLGVVERKLGKPDMATACYQRAIATDPSCAPAWRNLGNVWREDTQKWDEAIRCYKRLVELRPENARDRLDLGVAYAGARMRAEARLSFEQALELERDHIDATYNLAMWHLQESDPPRVRAWYRRLKSLSLASAQEFAEFVASKSKGSPEEADHYLSAMDSRDASVRDGMPPS